MGGAFVAVADDASAVYWNPAGLATGSYFSLVVDRNTLAAPDEADVTHGRSGLLVAIGTPPLGVAYYRTRVTTSQPYSAIDASSGGRNFIPGAVRLDSLLTDQAGVTLVQSIGRVLAIGGTLKYVHGTASSGITSLTGKAARELADDLPSKSSSTFDGDLGVMAVGAFGRVGVSVRNVGEPSFETREGFSLVLQRRVRGGVVLNLAQSLMVAADADFTSADVGDGRWRDAAVGAEAKVARGAWVRSGVHWNTAGGNTGPGAAPIVSIGGSYTVHGSLLADAQASVGSENGDRGWGVGVRFVF
jgi:hypothetical protein